MFRRLTTAMVIGAALLLPGKAHATFGRHAAPRGAGQQVPFGTIATYHVHHTLYPNGFPDDRSGWTYAFPVPVPKPTPHHTRHVAHHPVRYHPARPVFRWLPACYGFSITRWSAAVFSAERMTGFPSHVLAAVMTVESGGNPSVVSSGGAIGLMQLEPATAASLGVNPWNPWQNVLGGARYLAGLFRYGGMRYALAAYNGGAGNPQYGYANLVLSRVCA